MATSSFKSTTKRSSPISEPEYIKNAPRGKFVNTERGSGCEISLDDLALELFSSETCRIGRGIGRWANYTASSRRRGRSVSRTRGGDANKVFAPSSSRRRRSLSTSRGRQTITDSESEMDRSWNSSKHGDAKSSQMPILPTAKISGNHRQLGRSRSNKDLSNYLDGYSSQSSALTDEESRNTRITQNGFEKIIRTVYTRNKADDTTEEMASGGMYEAMKNELDSAFQDIRIELNQDKAKHDLAAMMLEEHQCSMSKELPNSRVSSAAVRTSRDRKRNTDRSRVSKNLIEEADKIIEDFVSSVEDTDISSFDGNRSDCSSSFGGMIKSRNAVIREEAEFYKSPMGSDSRTAEMDGVILPWLQWETSGDGSLLSRNTVTPKALKWDSEKETVMLHDPSSYSISSYGSWSPGPSCSPTSKYTLVKKSNNSSSFDMEEYLRLENDENILFQMYTERNRISSGGLLICHSGGFV